MTTHAHSHSHSHHKESEEKAEKAAEEKAEKASERAAAKEEKAAAKITAIDVSNELEAIRKRLGQRRRDVYGGTPGAFNTTDLADAEWLLVELDKSLGHEGMAPFELAELDHLEKLRVLTDPSDVAVWAKLQAKHGKLTTEELVMHEYLEGKLDAMLTVVQLSRYKELTAKQAKFAKAA